MNHLPLFLLISISFFTLETKAQKFISLNGQIKLSIQNTDCQIKAESKSLRSELDMEAGNCNFDIPMVAFEVKDREKREQFRSRCFSVSDYPMMTFEGKLLEVPGMNTSHEDILPMKLEGIWKINGENIPFSENVELYIEGAQISLSFNTELQLDKFILEMDCTMNYKKALTQE